MCVWCVCVCGVCVCVWCVCDVCEMVVQVQVDGPELDVCILHRNVVMA